MELRFSTGNNLIFGANGSGKTSVLEAAGYLGRGRSFRGATTRELIRHGAEEFVVFGRVDSGTRIIGLGVRNSRAGLEVHVDGEKQNSAAALAEALPLQLIDPDVHKLVGGGPEERRRFVDWIAFHVEHGYLERWRRFRRALKQRNAALRAGADRRSLSGWDRELTELGVDIDEVRRRMLDITRPAVERTGLALLGSVVDFDYQRGWAADRTLEEAMAGSAERDLQMGSTQSGPHRADIKLRYDERAAKKLVSRGQQKLLACSLVLAATEVVQAYLERPLLLLVDDPAAELDAGSVRALMGRIAELGCQVIATTLEPERPLFHDSPRLFHVERGVIRPAD